MTEKIAIKRRAVRFNRDVEAGGVHGNVSTPSPPQGLNGPTTPAAGTSKNIGTIVAGILVPTILIGIGLFIFYIWYRRKYPVRMVIGKDFSKFSNPKYNKRGSTMTLVRDDAEAAWEIPDSPNKREHALSSVKENDNVDEPDSKDTIQEDNANVEMQTVTNTEVNVGVEIAPPPSNIVRERPRKAQLVKTLDFADDLSENAFGTVTESDLDKRTDSDISSGNDSTETHTISLSFRETFDGRHRNTVSAVSSSDPGRNERGEHRANSFPHQVLAYTNSAHADKEDIRLRGNLSKSAGSVISPIDRDTVVQDKQNLYSFVKPKTENISDLSRRENNNFDTKTESEMQPNEYFDSVDNINEDSSAFIEITPAPNDASDNLVDMNENDKLETVTKTVHQNTEKTYEFSLNVDSLNPVREKTNDESFIVLQSTDALSPFSITPDKEQISACTSQIIEDTALSYPTDNSSHLISNDLTHTDTIPSPRTDIPYTVQNLQTEITEKTFPGSSNAVLVQEGIHDKTTGHLMPEGNDDSEATLITPEDLNENFEKRNITIQSGSSPPLFSVTTENDSLKSINVIEPLNNEYSESKLPSIHAPFSDEDESNMLHANPLSEKEVNAEVKSSLTVDRKASLTLSKDNLFLDAPPTPMIIVPDSYMHEPEASNPILLDIKDKENDLHAIQENPESQPSSRSNSFDFDFVTDFGYPKTSSEGDNLPAEDKFVAFNEMQESIQKNTFNNKTELQSASTDMLETPKYSDGDSQGQNILDTCLRNTNMGTFESFDKIDQFTLESEEKVVLEDSHLTYGEEVDKMPLTMENSNLGIDIPELSTERNTSQNAGFSGNTANGVSSDDILLDASGIPELSTEQNTSQNAGFSGNTANGVSSDDILLDASASIITEPFHSPSVFESANFNSFLNNDTWDKETSLEPLEIDINTPETHTQLNTFDIFEGGNTDLVFTSSMAASTDSSGPSWELISEASPNSKESNHFHLETIPIMDDSQKCEGDRNDKSIDLQCQQENLQDFARDECANRIEERKISDSFSSREGDMSWDIINESSDATDNGNHSNIDNDNGSSFA